jgi:hypothetical protein
VEYAIRTAPGRLSETTAVESAEEIRGFEFVARFNKMDNFQPGDPLTLVYLRLDPNDVLFDRRDAAVPRPGRCLGCLTA